MKISLIKDQIRNDLFGVLECEHCRAVQKFTGYDDANWHNNVLPKIECKTCGRDRPGEREPRTAAGSLD